MTTLARHRRHPAARFVVLVLGLLLTGAAYAAVASATKADAEEISAVSQQQIDEGRRLYLEGCSSCHGLQGQGSDNGPGVISAGAAAVHFQVATGRMPLAAPSVQATRKPAIYDEEQIAALAAYIASLGPGPAIPTAEQLDFSDADVAEGSELFRANCSQCHQAAGGGGALTEGKYAPTVLVATPQEIYEAMITGPQNMPVFADTTLAPEEKQGIIAYIEFLKVKQDPGGAALGRFGPVTEGLFLWIGAMVLLVAGAVWIGSRVR
jgi:ubiquinol-cytochrome c reductase cytochrome c subunit